MDYESLVPAIASLVGALVGASAALVAQRRQWKQDRNVDDDRQRKLDVEELLVRASSLDMASNQAASVTASFTSLAGQLNRLIRIVTPLDPQTLFNELNTHFEGLNRAAARVAITADQETVKLTNAVMVSAAAVIGAHHAAPPARWSLLGAIRNLFRGKPIGDQAAIKEARAALGESRRALIEHTRKDLRLPQVDVLATPEGLDP